MLYYVTIFLSSLCSLCQSNNCLLTLHHETISTHHNSSNILFISNSIRPVQHRHADQGTPQGSAKNDAVHNTRTTAPCSPHQRRDSLAFTQIQNQTEQTDRLPALVSPLRHISVTSPFGYRRDPFTKRKALHNGLDLKANYEPAYAMMHGEVIKVGNDKRSGLYVTLRHGDFTVSYCHLSQTLVTKGTHVHPGTVIALTGNSGRSTGPHLHLTLKKDGKNINPAILLSVLEDRIGYLVPQ